jgi:hypothetical protein
MQQPKRQQTSRHRHEVLQTYSGIINTFTIRAVHLWWPNYEGREKRACSTHGEINEHTISDGKPIVTTEDVDIYSKIILKCILQKCNAVVWNGFRWHRTEALPESVVTLNTPALFTRISTPPSLSFTSEKAHRMSSSLEMSHLIGCNFPGPSVKVSANC